MTRQADFAISVLIPAYNAEPYIAQSIDSVLAQTFQPAEIVVFDDGSSDGTYARSKAFGSRIRLLGPERRRIIEARNYLLDQAKHSWIAFQDADDLWMPDKLEKQVAWLQAHPEQEGCLGLAKQFLEPGCTFPPSYRKAILEEPSAQFFIPNLLVHRRVFDCVGRFEGPDESGTDLDWFVRAHDAGFSFGVVPEVLYRRRWHNTNSSTARDFDNRTILKVIRRSVQRKRRNI